MLRLCWRALRESANGALDGLLVVVDRGDERVGGQQEASDAGRVLEGAAFDLGRSMTPILNMSPYSPVGR
jgi:hypothetical protein